MEGIAPFVVICQVDANGQTIQAKGGRLNALGVRGGSGQVCGVKQDSSKTPSDWDSSKGLARAILHDRISRRKFLARFLLLTLGWMAVGLWVLDGWLADSAWRFLVWWAVCGVLALVLILFAAYDALMAIREEKPGRR